MFSLPAEGGLLTTPITTLPLAELCLMREMRSKWLWPDTSLSLIDTMRSPGLRPLDSAGPPLERER